MDNSVLEIIIKERLKDGDLHLHDLLIDIANAEFIATESEIKHLKIVSSYVGDDVASILAKSRSVSHLSLIINQIGDEGAHALAANSLLRELNLSENKIGDLGLAALARNPHITRLSIAFNNVSSAGMKAFIDNKSIEVLDVRGNTDGKEGAECLAAWRHDRAMNGNPVTIMGIDSFKPRTASFKSACERLRLTSGDPPGRTQR